MEVSNHRGQILIESFFVILSIGTLLILFQLMIDHQKKESASTRLSKIKKDILHVQSNEYIQTK